MQNSGESEFSCESKKIDLKFWPSFFLTLSGAAGLISMVADGPLWLTIPSFVITIGVLLWIIAEQAKNKKK